MFAPAFDRSQFAQRTPVLAPAPARHAPDNCVTAAIDTLRDRSANASLPFDDDASQALSVIYAAYAGLLLQTATRMLQSSSHAEDAVHDMFCRLPRLIARYDGRSFGAWLKCAVVSECLMQMRRTRSQRECAHDEAAMHVYTESAERDDELDRALLQLAPAAREVIVLRFFLNYSHREIATLLDITEAASEVRACRALKQLRLMLRGSAGNRSNAATTTPVCDENNRRLIASAR